MIDKNYFGKGRVAILKTKPETVLEDYARLLDLTEYSKSFPKDKETLFKINITWDTYYPSCSTTPWQLEGIIKKMIADGYDAKKFAAAHNKTVVVDARVGEKNNKHLFVTEKYNMKNYHLYEPQFEWVKYKPKTPFLVLDEIFPDGVKIPKIFYDKNIIQLPTVKTHVFTTITGAMKNSFGGLLSENRHWTHSKIHETLVDLLNIQFDIHSGLFAVMDGTFAGDGPGPRAMRWHEKDVILASNDFVALDAVSAYLQGFDPMSLKFIEIANNEGYGIGDIKKINIIGDTEILNNRWNFEQTETLASRGQKMIYHGHLKPFEKLLLRSKIVPWSFYASHFYHNIFWYPMYGKNRVIESLKTKWGKLFYNYGEEKGYKGVVIPEIPKKDIAIAAAALGGSLLGGMICYNLLKKWRND